MDTTAAALRQALVQVGDRWTLAVVAALLDGAGRFGDLQTAVDGIAPNVLSQRLRSLEADGLVVAAPYQHRPVRLRYELTARGRELERAIQVLAAWGDAAAGPVHTACGTALEATWWCPTCDGVAEPADPALHHL